MLKIENLESGYGKLSVLRRVSIEIGSESVGLFGPNGAGKHHPHRGHHGHGQGQGWAPSPSTRGGPSPASRPTTVARGGHRPRSPGAGALSPHGRWRTTSSSGQPTYPPPRATREEQLDLVLGLFPILKERYHQLAGTMSGGQQRQVAIGRALMARPRLLILDEPSLGLQPSIVAEVFEKLGDLKRSVSVLVTEQNVRESLRAIDRGLCPRERGRGDHGLRRGAQGQSPRDRLLPGHLTWPRRRRSRTWTSPGRSRVRAPTTSPISTASPCPSSHWKPFVDGLPGHRHLAHDFRGQILSGQGRGSHHPSPGRRPDFGALLDSLGMERVHLVGTSYGSAVGFPLRPGPSRSGGVHGRHRRAPSEVDPLMRAAVEAWRAAAQASPRAFYRSHIPLDLFRGLHREEPAVLRGPRRGYRRLPQVLLRLLRLPLRRLPRARHRR